MLRTFQALRRQRIVESIRLQSARAGFRFGKAVHMWASFKRYFFTIQCATGIPLAIKAGFDPELGLLGPVVAFLIASPLAALVAFIAAQRDMRGPVKSPPMTLSRGLMIAFVTFFMVIGVMTVMKILYDMYGQ
jgi:hypothetical protein